ncbi:glycine--tRNA ligase subunit beta [Acidiphilium sp. 34-64-41]|uniref:glycine--tRNA ligase subunit beta n=1 Tax=Acidiphilium sp. 34-64-41 TaxID=1970297 RepID=UPI00257E3194|nr:glycine--tRNA ligase subunit beta [Acidiphilium sp. 34-64-41]
MSRPLDRKSPLSDYLSELKNVTFHAKLGTQLDRAIRISKLSREIADLLGADGTESTIAESSGLLCKADLVTGMVGEFPELQGVMGGYYADDADVAAAIRNHYKPRGPSDDLPSGLVGCAVALADKIDTLREFFRIGELPTGSSDPYALRRAALGVIRIVLEKRLHLEIRSVLGGQGNVFDFILERFRIKLRSEGKKFDVLNAVLGAFNDDDLFRLNSHAELLGSFLASSEGSNLLVAYRRAHNILKIEDPDGTLLYSSASDFRFAIESPVDSPDHQLFCRLVDVLPLVKKETFGTQLHLLSDLRGDIDRFFSEVRITVDDPEIRRCRLCLLSLFCQTVDTSADFSKLEG